MVRGFESFQSAVSARKARANKPNARRSTGPKTEEGKRKSSRNALKHGVFCEGVLLPGEDEQAFRGMLIGFIHDLSPQTILELSLVEQIVAAQWRIRRSQQAEAIALGAMQNSIRADSHRRFSKLASKMGWDEREIHDDGFLAQADREDQDRICKLRALDVAMDIDLPPAMHLATMFVEPNNAVERFGRYEQRLQQTIHRCLRELERMRGKSRSEWDDLPPSPFVQCLCEEEEEAEEVEEIKKGEAEMSENVPPTEKAQNEPTVENPPASTGRAEGCSDLTSSPSPISPPTSSSPGNPGEAG